MCNPPDYEHNSKETVDLFNKEKGEICEALSTKARMVMETLSKCKNIKCNDVEGAMYVFPRIYLTESAIETAKAKDLEPSEYFCRQMLERTGIITVPGSGTFSPPSSSSSRFRPKSWHLPLPDVTSHLGHQGVRRHAQNYGRVY